MDYLCCFNQQERNNKKPGWVFTSFLGKEDGSHALRPDTEEEAIDAAVGKT